MNELALFAGAGGGILGGLLAEWNTVCAVECDAYAAAVLAQRQNDGILQPFPIWSDVRTFDGKPWRGIVDVVSGGFPCQDISVASTGQGIEGERSGLWSEFARIIGEVRPRYAYVENSPALTVRGLDRVLADIAALGVMRAGALHLRRIKVRGMNASGSGLLPTLTVHGNYNAKGASMNSGDGLATALRKYPTITANDARNNGN